MSRKKPYHNAPVVIGGVSIAPGERRVIDIPLSVLSDHTNMHMTVEAINGREAGPTAFVCAAIHGDEIIGVEIIRRLAGMKILKRLSGALILAPVVNAYGFVSLSRYLPDRRDLNRCFPGSAGGSLASQLAYIFMTEIVEKSQYGIDLHSGAIHRANLPQLRANLDDKTVRAMAEAFGAPVMLHAGLRDGSLREAAQAIGCNMLLYEAGEALRFDEAAIRIGVAGVVNVLRQIGMLPPSKTPKLRTPPMYAKSSHWLRAPMGGVLRSTVRLGDKVSKDAVLAVVSDPLGKELKELKAREAGVVIGRSRLPIVNRGDAVFHVACSKGPTPEIAVADHVAMRDPLYDGMEVI